VEDFASHRCLEFTCNNVMTNLESDFGGFWFPKVREKKKKSKNHPIFIILILVCSHEYKKLIKKVSTWYLVYSQVWQNVPQMIYHFWYVFLWTNHPLRLHSKIREKSNATKCHPWIFGFPTQSNKSRFEHCKHVTWRPHFHLSDYIPQFWLTQD